MRCGLILAAGLVAMPLASIGSAAGAHAQEYCGFNPHPGSIVECGYSSRQGCENAIGKGAMCFVSPYTALNTWRGTPLIVSRAHPARG
jgi:Protein of unknown function (DUF3551)